MPSVSERIVAILAYVPMFDMFGDSVDYDPARFPRSWRGAVVSVVFVTIAVVLAVTDMIQLASSVSSTGSVVSISYSPVNLNPLFVDTVQLQPIDFQMAVWDFPTLILETTNTIDFYSAGTRGVHKVEVVDNVGYHSWLTSFQGDTAVASGLYQKISVSLGTMNPVASLGVPSTQVSMDMMSSLSFQGFHAKAEPMLILRERVAAKSIFFPHTAYVYVRLDKAQLSQLKMCQLQISMMNQAEYAGTLSTASRASDQGKLNTLRSSMDTWAPANFGFDHLFASANGSACAPTSSLDPDAPQCLTGQLKWNVGHMSMIRLQSGLTQSDADLIQKRALGTVYVDDEDLLNWRMDLTYVPNFAHLFSTTSCTDDSSFDLAFSGALLPRANDTLLWTLGQAPQWPMVPFQVAVSFEDILEVVTVVAVLNNQSRANAMGAIVPAVMNPQPFSAYKVSGQVLQVVRSAPVDFGLLVSALRVRPSLQRTYPSNWYCQWDWYNDGKWSAPPPLPPLTTRVHTQRPSSPAFLPQRHAPIGPWISDSEYQCKKVKPRQNDMLAGEIRWRDQEG